ncbi:fructose-bisphosphate aldolase-lysine N-methyltransferase, chloroplastic isoform X2 [Asparagus officinalis]|uniref:fructose-bisphosphate aldolase-lysine N-methyltransferase, chloroplastic isoform X2 n=1 Tax=Asparagus officinalis TaxID=4686 RepID=UPI00098E7ED3|nr:fructose-bisphosphate aldolase-lysine N-methyltransferase, chloroplastic isoform X2 [Asparagus officinalis]
MFWSEEELTMVRASSIYQEIIDQKAHLEKEFLALKPVLDRWHQNIGDIKLEDFMYACALIISRAWRTSKGISLIPFADFLNHDGISEAVLLSDDIKETSEVIADRDYAVGEQVLIRYGKFPNATLMLDFGFTHPYNIHDQVQIWMDLPKHDPLYSSKLGILAKHWFPSSPEANDLNSSGCSFLIREVKSPKAKGKGIPQALRAYTRILSITSHEELEALVIEAAENDGRLARLPLRNTESEIHAHSILLSQFTHLIQERDAAVKVLESMSSLDAISRVAIRKKMAIDLLNGEIRVLRSACAWLTNYCANLSACNGGENIRRINTAL